MLDGYVKRIRDDGKVDLSLDQPGFSKDKIESVTDAILAALHENDGFLALTDKSPPPEIYAAFRVSKKVFKQAIGGSLQTAPDRAGEHGNPTALINATLAGTMRSLGLCIFTPIFCTMFWYSPPRLGALRSAPHISLTLCDG